MVNYMKNEFKLPFYLAFQSIRRGRKWTLFLTIFLMAVAFINLVFISALFNGVVEGSNQQIKNTMTGNVYMAPKEGQTSILNREKLLGKVRNVDNVQAATSSFQIPAQIKKDARSGSWPVLGIKPEEYSDVFTIPKHMLAGNYLSLNDSNGIILGRQIAGGEGAELNSTSLKGAKVGDKVIINYSGIEKTLTVRGIFYTKFTQTDSTAFITDKALQEMLPQTKGQATMINIKTLDKNEQKVYTDVKSVDPNVDTFLWTEAAGLMKSVSSSFTSINVLMTFVGTVIAAVTVFIVIYVDIINRRRQIGILRAIGIRPYIIVLNYVLLAAVYATLGVLLGSAIFYFALVPYFQAHPFSLPITDAVLTISTTEYFTRVEIISWVAIISGLIPALIVTKTKMIDAILGR